MAPLRPALIPLVCALALVGSPAAAATSFGVADDTGKYADDGGRWFFGQLLGLGMTDNRISINWDPSRPSVIPERAFLDRSMAVAALTGVRIVASVQAERAKTLTESPERADQFAAFLQLLVRTYPGITDVKVGNEPNQPRFWQPQFAEDGTPLAAATYTPVLAKAYDALKAVDPKINVIAAGISSRGNDDADAANNRSTSPVRFLEGMGAWYRASGRTRPIMDELGFHPYPRSPQDSLQKGFQWPNAGVANVDRIKQAVWDAFNGTAQPTFENGLTLAIDEIGWQVGVVPQAQTAYYGAENAPTTDETAQAELYRDLIRLVTCDSAITKLYLFGLVDERDLGGFQSALIRADRTHRPSFDAVAGAIAETRGRCTGTPVSWRHAPAVLGAKAAFRPGQAPKPPRSTSWSFGITAEEDAKYEAGVFRVEGPRAARRFRFPTAVRRAPAARATLSAAGTVTAYWTPLVQFPKRQLKPGYYVYAVKLTADTNAKRVSTFTSPAFRVGVPAPGKNR